MKQKLRICNWHHLRTNPKEENVPGDLTRIVRTVSQFTALNKKGTRTIIRIGTVSRFIKDPGKKENENQTEIPFFPHFYTQTLICVISSHFQHATMRIFQEFFRAFHA